MVPDECDGLCRRWIITACDGVRYCIMDVYIINFIGHLNSFQPLHNRLQVRNIKACMLEVTVVVVVVVVEVVAVVVVEVVEVVVVVMV